MRLRAGLAVSGPVVALSLLVIPHSAMPAEGSKADLVVTKLVAAPSPGEVGKALAHTIVITNSGPAAAHDLVAEILVSPTRKRSMRRISANASEGSCQIGTYLWVCRRATLAVGATWTITTAVQVSKAQTITSRVRVTSATDDPDTKNNAADLSTSVLAASKSGELSASSIPVTLQEDGTVYWSGKVTATATFAAEPGKLSFGFNMSVAQVTAAKDCKSPPGSIHPCLSDWQYLDQRIAEVRVTFDNGTTSTKQSQYGNWTVTVPPSAHRVVRLDAVLNGADVLYSSTAGKTYVARSITWVASQLASISLSSG